MIYSSITIKEENMKDLTKAELIQKLENLSHLKTTVHAKDVQIAELKKQHEEKIKKTKQRKRRLSKKIYRFINKRANGKSNRKTNRRAQRSSSQSEPLYKNTSRFTQANTTYNRNGTILRTVSF
jgi:hypothetical protein